MFGAVFSFLITHQEEAARCSEVPTASLWSACKLPHRRDAGQPRTPLLQPPRGENNTAGVPRCFARAGKVSEAARRSKRRSPHEFRRSLPAPKKLSASEPSRYTPKEALDLETPHLAPDNLYSSPRHRNRMATAWAHLLLHADEIVGVCGQLHAEHRTEKIGHGNLAQELDGPRRDGGQGSGGGGGNVSSNNKSTCVLCV